MGTEIENEWVLQKVDWSRAVGCCEHGTELRITEVLNFGQSSSTLKTGPVTEVSAF
jgi:hypothetical protein